MAYRSYTWSSSSQLLDEINNRIRERDAIQSPAAFKLKYIADEENLNNKLRNDYYSKQGDLKTAIDQYNNAVRNGVDLTKNENYNKEYNNYVNDYTRRGERAMNDTLGKLASRTGGLASSYTSAMAQQAYGNYMDALADKINTLNHNYNTNALNGLADIRNFYQSDKTREQSNLTTAINNYLNMDNARKGEWQSGYDKYKGDISVIDALISALSRERSTSMTAEENEKNRQATAEENEKNRQLQRELAELKAQAAAASAAASSGRRRSSYDDDDDDDDIGEYQSPDRSDRIWVDGTAFGLSELLQGEAEGWFKRDSRGNWVSVPKYDSRGFRLRNPYTGR